jgi:hypothetical protein
MCVYLEFLCKVCVLTLLLNTYDLQVGHWLGLEHTFHNGCEAPGDEVEDTPPENPLDEFLVWCQLATGRDTCPASGLDPINNFMTYVSDDCMTSFTPGQIQRMQEMWNLYRRPPGRT